MTDIKKYWDDSLNLDEYIQTGENRLTASDTPEDFREYYELGNQRTQRALKTFKIDENQRQTLESSNFNGHILIISEPWCGDASATVPAVYRFFEDAGIETRIFLRDNDQSLINQFLTDGTQSIPKVLILNENFELLNSWGPRPKFGRDLLHRFKNNPEEYPKEKFYNDLQVYYAKNRGKDAIAEILELL